MKPNIMLIFVNTVCSALQGATVLKCHVRLCLVINHTKSILFAEEDEYVHFQNFKRSVKALVLICSDFECVLIPSTCNVHFVPNNEKYKDYIVCSYGYKLICVDDQYSKPWKIYFSKDAIDTF